MEDLSRRPLRPNQYQYAVGKMLFATVTMAPNDDKDSLAAFETKVKVNEYAKQPLQSRLLPNQYQYAAGKMLFATVTMAPDDDKDSLAAFETKVNEYAKQPLQSRLLPNQYQYAAGKMLFATVTMAPDDDKDSLAAFETKVNEYAKQSLQSRLLHCDEVESGNPGLTWIEITPKLAMVCGESGPLMPVRLLVSPTHYCKLQVMWPLVRTVHATFVQGSADESFIALLQQILPTSPYGLCQQYGAIHRDVQGLQKICNGSTVCDMNQNCVRNGMCQQIKDPSG